MLHMRNIILIILGLIFCSTDLLSQDYEKVYLDASDSARYYYKVIPDIQAKGLLILLPGCRGNSEWPLRTTRIPYIAADSGLVTVMIDYELWLSWLRDDVLESLNAAISDVIKVYDIPKDRCMIGGFSSGGNMVLSFAEFAMEDNKKNCNYTLWSFCT
jgi:poly(3-hydroxybutyrate) depolymerase